MKFLDYLRANFTCDPATGELRHRRPISKGWPIPPGTRAGSRTKAGYLRTTVCGRAYMVHRLIWLFVHGNWPRGFLDHRNGVRTDNRIANLRVLSKRGNACNRIAPNKNNRSGFIGATYRPRQGWVSQIGHKGRQYVLGYFESPEEAHLLYLMAKIQLHTSLVRSV